MLEPLPEIVELRVSTVLERVHENGKASLDVQHLIPPTPRQWSAAVGCHRLQLPTGASRPPTGATKVSPRLQLRLPPIDGSRASPRGSRRAGSAVPIALCVPGLLPLTVLHLRVQPPQAAHATSPDMHASRPPPRASQQ